MQRPWVLPTLTAESHPAVTALTHLLRLGVVPLVCVLAAVFGGLGVLAVQAATRSKAAVEAPPALAVGTASGTLFPVEIRGPLGPPTVVIGTHPRTGEPLVANCTTCHATRAPVPANAHTADLDGFHQGLVMQHGGISCLTCHDPDGYDRLRLADGTSIPHTDALRLCGQCHGPQYRDWRNGSHGGMTGYWDLTRGPRTRNHCLVCHDPHAPALGQVLPAPPPNDRFLRPHDSHDSHDAPSHD